MSTISSFCNLKYIEFKKRLANIKEMELPLLFKSQAALIVCGDCIKDIDHEILTRGLPSEKEETSLLNLIKIKLTSECIFHYDLITFRKDCPSENVQEIETHIKWEQEKITQYLEYPRNYGEYIKFDLEYKSHIYLVRGEYKFKYYVDSSLPGSESQFYVMKDAILSCMIAGKRLHGYLGKILETGDLAFKTTAPWLESNEEAIDEVTGDVRDIIHRLFS